MFSENLSTSDLAQTVVPAWSRYAFPVREIQSTFFLQTQAGNLTFEHGVLIIPKSFDFVVVRHRKCQGIRLKTTQRHERNLWRLLCGDTSIEEQELFDTPILVTQSW